MPSFTYVGLASFIIAPLPFRLPGFPRRRGRRLLRRQVGAGIGLPWFNSHPAEVFMGRRRRLAVAGRAIGSVAVATQAEIRLVLVGGVFVM